MERKGEGMMPEIISRYLGRMVLQLPMASEMFIPPEPMLECGCHVVSMGGGVLITKC